LAEDLQKKYSSSKYNARLRRRSVLNRVRHFPQEG
jgi:hypothetical protein